MLAFSGFSNMYIQFQLFFCWTCLQLYSLSWVQKGYNLLQQFQQWLENRKQEPNTFHVILSLYRFSKTEFQLFEFEIEDPSVAVSEPGLYILQKKRNAQDDIQYLGYRSLTVPTPIPGPVPTPMNTCFLSVEYICDDTRLFLELPSSFFMSGSEILSAEFIRWWLEYHSSESFDFHGHYKINLTDFQLNYFSIGFTESILLDKTCPSKGYKILSKEDRRRERETVEDKGTVKQYKPFF